MKFFVSTGTNSCDFQLAWRWVIIADCTILFSVINLIQEVGNVIG
jgi:hypothetical protein